MTPLQNMGLAEKIVLVKVTMYKATPIKEGLSILLQRQKEEYSEIEKQVKTIFNNFNENKNEDVLPENAQFIITSELTLLLKTHEKLADMTKKSIDAIISLKMDEKNVFQYFPYFKGAMKRGVKIRVIRTNVCEESMPENPKPLPKNPLFEIKYLLEGTLPFGMHIFDEQEVTLAMCEKKPMPSLWTNDIPVVKLAQFYFENMWEKARINQDS
jgi:sugar-specific transcriptional regulator TrmB